MTMGEKSLLKLLVLGKQRTVIASAEEEEVTESMKEKKKVRTMALVG